MLSWQPFISFECRQADCDAAGALLKDGGIVQQGYKALVVCHRCRTAQPVSHVRMHLTELATYPPTPPPNPPLRSAPSHSNIKSQSNDFAAQTS